MSDAPIKVLFVVNSLRFGGAEKHVVTLLNHLDPVRYALALTYLKPGDELLPQLNASRLRGGVSYAAIRGRFDIGALRRLAAQIAGHDVVVCTNSYAMAYAMLARGWASRKPPVIEVFHTTDLGSRKARWQMRLYRPFFAACDLLVYVCENQRRHWAQRGLRAREQAVIHNGIDPEYFRDTYSAEQKQALRRQFGFGPDELVVGLCAVMRPEKAHGDLLLAVARLRAAGMPVKALLIGDGVERANIEARIAAMELRDAVKISGFISDVRPLIASCDVMTLVSHHVETFSIAALEAMSLGKPIVMTRIGGAAEQLTDGVNGYLYPAGDIPALTAALERCLDPAHRKTLGDTARRVVVEQFSVPTMTAKFAAAIDRLAARAGGRDV